MFSRCRQEQAIFDECMLRKMGMERPPFGYFTQVRLHDPERPRPEQRVPKYPDHTPALPSDFPIKPAIHGQRNWFFIP